MVEALTYRQGGHKRDDPATYRDKKEVDAWLRVDPITLMRDRMVVDKRFDEEGIAVIEKRVDDEIEQAVEFAIAAEVPPISDATEDVYA